MRAMFWPVLLAGAVALGAFVRAEPVGAEPVARQYSADLVIQAQGQTLNAKLYVAEGKTRTEMQMPAIPGAPTGMGTIIAIARADMRKAYMLFPDTKTYSEQPIKLEDLQLAGTSHPNAHMQELGREAIDGQPCIKYQISYEGQAMWMWVTQSGGFPVRMMPSTGGMVTDFRNVRVGPQSASLFEIPAGYQQADGMGGMLQEVLGGLDAGAGEDLQKALRDLTGQ